MVYIDENVPNLLAFGSGEDLSKSAAYQNGDIILQDKASCFPAHLLLRSPVANLKPVGDVVDACAAPGNKTSHLASMLCPKSDHEANTGPKIYACERNAERSLTLKKMLHLVGAMSLVTVLERQDFLALDPLDSRFQNVTHLLLDPSCSGSGITNREDVPNLALPDRRPNKRNLIHSKVSKKRKRDLSCESGTVKDVVGAHVNDVAREEMPEASGTERLRKLSNLQTRIIEHAFAFPAADMVTYSTCSTHVTENEEVVARALASQVAHDRSWRVLRREEQVDGLQRWQDRGLWSSNRGGGNDYAVRHELDQEQLDACIRCVPETHDGTMGFFLCGFVRDVSLQETRKARSADFRTSQDEEWEGFVD